VEGRESGRSVVPVKAFYSVVLKTADLRSLPESVTSLSESFYIISRVIIIVLLVRQLSVQSLFRIDVFVATIP